MLWMEFQYMSAFHIFPHISQWDNKTCIFLLSFDMNFHTKEYLNIRNDWIYQLTQLTMSFNAVFPVSNHVEAS